MKAEKDSGAPAGTALHTPGPWHTCEADGQPWTIEDSHGKAIALANQIIGDPPEGQPERTANAKLLAAAAALAGACERMLTTRGCGGLGEVYEAVRAALRAAGRLVSRSEPAEGRPSPEIPAIPGSKG